MYFVFYGLHDTTLQICIISLYECFAYDITVVVKINLFQCQCVSVSIISSNKTSTSVKNINNLFTDNKIYYLQPSKKQIQDS